MDLGIAGRKAIVCASSKGLGRGCAEALAEAGCHLVLNARDRHVLYETATAIATRYKVEVTPIAGDISKRDVQKALLAAFPEPDILVNNNAGPPRRGFRELDREKIVEGLVQNMVTPIELIMAVLDGMAGRKFGRIVNITSAAVFSPIEGLDLSSGARAGLTAFLAGVCREVAADNVTINNVLPGRFNTERLTSGWAATAKRTDRPVADIAERAIAEVPARRLGTPEEFGQLCAFLCSTHAGYITGQNFLIDGGLFPAAF